MGRRQARDPLAEETQREEVEEKRGLVRLRDSRQGRRAPPGFRITATAFGLAQTYHEAGFETGQHSFPENYKTVGLIWSVVTWEALTIHS